MGIKVKLGSAVEDGITDAELAQKPGIKVRLDIRKTLDGNLIIADHPDIDIIIMTKDRKIVAMAKRLNSGVVYGAQNRLFEFLLKKGVVDPSSIRGGNIYASLEADIPPADELPAIKIAILNIAKWLDSEKPASDFVEDYEEEVSDNYIEPEKPYSTELGEVPQAAEKGSIKPGVVRAPYGVSMYNYYGY
tara:strand:+ start:834 stop:1403 length:570 start_codon:yes stop_codon:yes gene_type:complete